MRTAVAVTSLTSQATKNNAVFLTVQNDIKIRQELECDYFAQPTRVWGIVIPNKLPKGQICSFGKFVLQGETCSYIVIILKEVWERKFLYLFFV